MTMTMTMTRIIKIPEFILLFAFTDSSLGIIAASLGSWFVYCKVANSVISFAVSKGVISELQARDYFRHRRGYKRYPESWCNDHHN